MTAPIRAIVFDLDGVLVDTEPWWFEARAEVAAAMGGRWSAADEVAVKGANSREWAAAVAARLGSDGMADEVERAVVAAVVARYGRDAPPTIGPGIDAVRRLTGRRALAVGSSAHPPSSTRRSARSAARVVRDRPLVRRRRGGKPAPTSTSRWRDGWASRRHASSSRTRWRGVKPRRGRDARRARAGSRPPAAEGAETSRPSCSASPDALDDDRLAALEAVPPPHPG
jgi:hypothetical protein